MNNDTTGPQRWRLLRNCRLPPTLLLGGALAPAVLGLALSLPFLARGYGWIAALALLQALALAAAVLHYCTHAQDGEELTLQAGRLRLTQRDGWQVRQHDWNLHAVRVQPPGADQPHLVLRAGGQEHTLGRHRPPGERAWVAHQLRQALARAAQQGEPRQPST